MTDKLEVAKLATQLTAALIESKQLPSTALHRAFSSSDEPDVVVVFDYLFKHIQTVLAEQ